MNDHDEKIRADAYDRGYDTGYKIGLTERRYAFWGLIGKWSARAILIFSVTALLVTIGIAIRTGAFK